MPQPQRLPAPYVLSFALADGVVRTHIRLLLAGSGNLLILLDTAAVAIVENENCKKRIEYTDNMEILLIIVPYCPPICNVRLSARNIYSRER